MLVAVAPGLRSPLPRRPSTPRSFPSSMLRALASRCRSLRRLSLHLPPLLAAESKLILPNGFPPRPPPPPPPYSAREFVAGFRSRDFGSVAEAVFSTDADEELPRSLDGLAKLPVESEVVEQSGELQAVELLEPGKPPQQQPQQRPRQRPKIVHGMTAGKYTALRKRQIKIETEAWEKAAEEYRELLEDMCKQKLSPNLPYVKLLFLGWFEPFRDAIAKEQEATQDGRNRQSHRPYFSLLPADMMAVITMHKLMSLLMGAPEGDGSVRVVKACIDVGEAIEQEIKIQKFLEKTKRKPKKEKDKEHEEKEDGDQQRLRKKVTDLLKKQKHRHVKILMKKQDDNKPWGQDIHAKVGSRLIGLLMENAYIQPPASQVADGPPDIRPAFRHSTRTTVRKDKKNHSRRFGVIECDPLVRQGMERTARHMVISYMPMLIPPVKWTGYDKGAHLFLPSYLMRTHKSKQQREAIRRAPVSQMQPIFQALDTLGNTKWRINKRVLSIVDRIWSSGGRLAGLVDTENLPLPSKPETEDETELKRWRWNFNAVKKENSERHSQKCDVELKLAVARKMKDEKGFFYPHNLDFRGRAYPMHSHLNHLGSDMCRGLLEFEEGRPLGVSGLRWLKIHLANLYAAGGVDKLSYDGRVTFTENHINDIFDSADRPLEGRRWWLGAEDPCQCLAVCFVLAEALRSSSPETTISHLPVHQDGSCNGLQHYAALGRDKLGAIAVNLIAGEKPSDVYSGIASRVLDIMRQDSQLDPSSYPNAIYARMLLDQVDRKLVKQTAMTSVYGVTLVGAREQIKKRLKERGVIPDDTDMFRASSYAAKVTLAAIGDVCEGARSIMGWLGDCAKVIASQNQAVKWTTPLGLPVVQPYKKLGYQNVKTSLQTLSLQKETDKSKVEVKRQRTAFPPNFIHSLDGSHMMLTAVACRDAGLTFAGVHDSYWTHACDVDRLNRILREKFVELYEQPILEDLLESFEKSFTGVKFPPLPERGDLDMKDVLNSTYFFN